MSSLIEAMIRTMEQDDTVGPVNIGMVEFTIRELADAVLSKIDTNSGCGRTFPSDDPTQPDISLAQNLAEPEIEL